MVTEEILEKASFLHDIGRIVLKHNIQNNCSIEEAGVKYLSPYLQGGDGELIQSLLLRENYQKSMLGSVLHQADIIATGVDVRGKSGEKDILANLFNRFGNESKAEETYFPPGLMQIDNCPYPSQKVDTIDYSEPLSFLTDKLKQKNIVERTSTDLARILEIAFNSVPASNPDEGLSDISLYDHSRLVAAIAGCLYSLVKDKPDGEALTCLNSPELYQKNIFLLASGDISGVQKFIYTIPSKGALKSLRGRSFYLDILLEHIADEILAVSKLSRSNLLYTGGGHFYLLLPNSEQEIGYLQDFANRINDWFLHQFATRLYLAFAWTPSAASEFMGETPNGAGEPFRRASEELSKQKLCRYTGTQLRELFHVDSKVNFVEDGSRECSICHTSVKKLEPYNEEDETLACEACHNLYQMGKTMLDGDAFIVSTLDNGRAVPLPGNKQELYLYPAKWQNIQKNRQDIIRVYVKNQLYIDDPRAIYLWLADYTTKNDGKVLTFEELAENSSGRDENTGIFRLGVLRADVDNLGAAFIAGFSGKLATLSRTGSLSRRLSMFFKRYINEICAGNLQGTNQEYQEKFSIFGKRKDAGRNIHVVYSGGDDVFLVGAWDDLIEVAVDIRRAFQQYTNGKLTFSAGIGFFPPKCPVSVLASETGKLEDAAKDNPNKDSIALFGSSTEVHNDSLKYDEPECFHWSEFIEQVCGEKLEFLRSNFVLPPNQDDLTKLPIGKSGLYRLLSLLKAAQEKDSINLARFAYVLAKMNPGNDKGQRTEVYQQIRTQLYQWYKSVDDRKQLRTAIELLIYSLREKKDDL